MKRIFIIIPCLVLAFLAATLAFAVYNEYRPKQIFAYIEQDEVKEAIIVCSEDEYYWLNAEEHEKTLSCLKNISVYEKSKPAGNVVVTLKLLDTYRNEILTMVLYEEHLLYGDVGFRCESNALTEYFKGIMKEYRDDSSKKPFADLNFENVVKITAPCRNDFCELDRDKAEYVVNLLKDLVTYNREDTMMYLYGGESAWFELELSDGQTIELWLALDNHIYIGTNNGQKKRYWCDSIRELVIHYREYWGEEGICHG